jgi:hypothetical protein
MKNIILLLLIAPFNSYSQSHKHVADSFILSQTDMLNTFPLHQPLNCFVCPQDSANFAATILPDYFILGTLDDYMGRSSYVDREKQVDRYYPFEEPIIKFMLEYIRTNYNIACDTIFLNSRHGGLYSPSMAKKLNGYYAATGNLTDSLFKTEEQVYSFLLGNYYRYGEKLANNILLFH